MLSWKITFRRHIGLFYKTISAHNIKDALDYFTAIEPEAFIFSIEMVIPNAG
jgi:hypothetical protein